MLLVGSPCALPCSCGGSSCWFFENVAASCFTNSRVLEVVILGEHVGRQFAKIVRWFFGSSRKTSFLGFFCLFSLCVLGSKGGLGALYFVCLWPIVVCA